MKKILGIFMLMLLACNVLAEDMIYPSVTASVLSPKGASTADACHAV